MKCVIRAYLLLDSHILDSRIIQYYVICMSCIANITIQNVFWHSVCERKSNQSCLRINWKLDISIGTLNTGLYWIEVCFSFRNKITITSDGRKQIACMVADNDTRQNVPRILIAFFIIAFFLSRVNELSLPLILYDLIWYTRLTYTQSLQYQLFPNVSLAAARWKLWELTTKMQEDMLNVIWYQIYKLKLTQSTRESINTWVFL